MYTYGWHHYLCVHDVECASYHANMNLKRGEAFLICEEQRFVQVLHGIQCARSCSIRHFSGAMLSFSSHPVPHKQEMIRFHTKITARSIMPKHRPLTAQRSGRNTLFKLTHAKGRLRHCMAGSFAAQLALRSAMSSLQQQSMRGFESCRELFCSQRCVREARLRNAVLDGDAVHGHALAPIMMMHGM